MSKMRRIFVTPKETFVVQGVTFPSEKDGGGQLLGYLNEEKETIDFPTGTASGSLSFSIPVSKFDFDGGCSSLVSKLRDENEQLKNAIKDLENRTAKKHKE